MIHYDPHKWTSHFFQIRGSLLKEIGLRVLLCILWAAGVVWVDMSWRDVGIPSLLHTLLGGALGLLLVFRTNASYDRFWEGRRLWGGIVNESRNLIRGARAHLGEREPELLAQLTRWAAIFPWSGMNQLRGVDGLGPWAGQIPAAERERVLAAQHTALAVAQAMSACLVRARDRGAISDFILVSLDQNIQLLVDYLGGCERIRKTPLPFAYAVHLRRSLVLYCLTLPFAMVDTFGWLTIFDVAIVSYVFFGIEEIGVEIEGPFGHDDNDLPLEEICETIHRNVYAMAGLELLERETIPPEGL
jgi:ion channel-forming bestrophin family protein